MAAHTRAWRDALGPGLVVFASVTRISDLATKEVSVEAVPRSSWRTGDYVVGEVLDDDGGIRHVELSSGRLSEVLTGDILVGALGQRHATLEAVGDWRGVGPDLEMYALTRAGVIGACTSVSMSARPSLVKLRYRGHAVVDGRPARMSDYVRRPGSGGPVPPVVLIIGTSMSAGKTTSAKAIIRVLAGRGLRVAGAKVTGVARMADGLQMADAGACVTVDLVDAGLPSTICSPEEYRDALAVMLGRVSDEGVDVLVAEAGASPLEPYNGDVAVGALAPHVRFTLLCASDPYAVHGVMSAFGTTPDLVAGRAAGTTAGVELVQRLCGVSALDLSDRHNQPVLDELLTMALGLAPAAGTGGAA